MAGTVSSDFTGYPGASHALLMDPPLALLSSCRIFLMKKRHVGLGPMDAGTQAIKLKARASWG